jgi:fibro-slime domain-containing protein
MAQCRVVSGVVSIVVSGLCGGLVACGGDDGTGAPLDGDAGIDATSPVDVGGFGDDNPPQCGTLRATIRDFKIDHPDFEVTPAADTVIPGLVEATITPGGRPAYRATAPAAGLITSATTFAEWYQDVPNVNQAFARDFALTEVSPGTYVFDEPAFFPIDGLGFGDEGNPHNYHFTTELHATFPYQGGERFTFRGDDDVWVFVNGHLAIDIGGVHNAAEQVIDFDARATELGIAVGSTYAIDFFQAERHVTGSSFRIETSIACFIIL